LPDVPPTPKGEDPFPFFDNYSWRSFIALNWPAMTGAANRGRPDRAKAFGEFNSIVSNKWYIASNLPTPPSTIARAHLRLLAIGRHPRGDIPEVHESSAAMT
jgi:hypothetical protein